MKRTWIGVLLSLMLMTALAGCSSNDHRDPASSPSVSPENTVPDDLQRAGEDMKEGVDRMGDDLSRAAGDMKSDFDRMVENGKVG